MCFDYSFLLCKGRTFDGHLHSSCVDSKPYTKRVLGPSMSRNAWAVFVTVNMHILPPDGSVVVHNIGSFINDQDSMLRSSHLVYIVCIHDFVTPT